MLGNCLGPGGNVARVSALAAGLGGAIPGVTIDRQCASGLEAVGVAARAVASGDLSLVLAGGVESRAPRHGGTGHRRPLVTNRGVTGAPPSPPTAGPTPTWASQRTDWPTPWASVGRPRTSTPRSRTRAAVAAVRAGMFDAEILPVGGVRVGRASSGRAGNGATRPTTPRIRTGRNRDGGELLGRLRWRRGRRRHHCGPCGAGRTARPARAGHRGRRRRPVAARARAPRRRRERPCSAAVSRSATSMRWRSPRRSRRSRWRSSTNSASNVTSSARRAAPSHSGIRGGRPARSCWSDWRPGCWTGRAGGRPRRLRQRRRSGCRDGAGAGRVSRR